MHSFSNRASLAWLPAISTQLKNGTVVETAGDRIPHVIESLPQAGLVKRQISPYSPPASYAIDAVAPPSTSEASHAPRSISWPGFGAITADEKLFINIGLAIGDSLICNTEGEQRCVADSRIVLTCNRGGLWSVLQACGDATLCKTNPDEAGKILCLQK